MIYTPFPVLDDILRLIWELRVSRSDAKLKVVLSIAVSMIDTVS